MEETVKAIAGNLRRLRTARGLSAAALARESGVARATLAELENGRGNPTVETLYGLARVLGVTFADLLVQADAPPVHVVRADEGPQVPGAVVQARLLRQASVERTRVAASLARVVEQNGGIVPDDDPDAEPPAEAEAEAQPEPAA